MKPHMNAKLSSTSSSALESITSYLNRNDLRRFNISAFEIHSLQKGLKGDRKKAALRAVIQRFEDMLRKYKQLPADKSFSRVLTALRKLERADEAIKIFNMVSRKAHPDKVGEIIGAWSYTSLLEIYERKIKQAKEDDTEQADIFAKAQEVWKVYKQKFQVDSYAATSMMNIYKEAGMFQEAIDIFDTYKNRADLDMYSKCINVFIRSKKIDKALSLLEEMEQKYKKISNKISRDCNNMRIAYNLLIIDAFKYKEDLNLALKLFENGTSLGIYQTNQIQDDIEVDMVRLNFHLSEDYRNEEGGLPLEVAKIAFLYFMQQIKAKDIHVPATLITGGHLEGRTKLKDEFPKFLETEYQVQVEWNKNPRRLEFIIPYRSLRKIRFIHDIWEYMDTQQDLFPDDETAYRELKRRYRADLRRANENRSDKHFSEKLTIPEEFTTQEKQLAEAGINSYETKKYKEAEQHYRKLIDSSPTHPWAYVQLGWVLHRTEWFDEAIIEYNKGKELNSLDSDDAKKLQSEIYRRVGWAYDRKHRQDEKEVTLATAIQHYEQAHKLNPINYEVYNNWGIGLYRAEQYQEAIQKFEIVRQKKPNHDEACVHLGNCYRKLGKFTEAEKYYKEAIERSKQFDEGRSSAWAYYNLGKLYLQRYEKSSSDDGLFNLAQNAFEKCMELQPERDQAHKGLSKLHEIKGNQDQALENRKKAEEITPRRENLINKGKKGTEGSSSTSAFFASEALTHVEAVPGTDGLVP